MRLVFATSNEHKVEEAREILGPSLAVVSLRELGTEISEPVEDGSTFEANAELKGRHYAAALGQNCLAEDSGLVVDALGGAPGVHSARYAGVRGERQVRDRANNHKLVSELAGVAVEDRTARFVCAACVVAPSGAVVARARGQLLGRISLEPAGGAGFGYDPLFFYPPAGCTTAQLAPAEKNAISHRAMALRALARALAAQASS